MKFSTLAFLRVLSMLMIPVGLLLLLAAIAPSSAMRPFDCYLCIFLGLLGNVVCDIAEKPNR